MPGIKSEVAQRAKQLRLRNQRVTDARPHRELADTAYQPKLGRLEHELVAGKYLTLEPRVIDTCEKDERLVVRSSAQRLIDQNHRYLRQRLDNKDPRHHRVAWKMSLKKRFADGDVLDRFDVLPGSALDNLVDEQKRRPMRQVSHDLLDIHCRHGHSLFLPALFSSTRSSVRTRVAKLRSLRSTDATYCHSRCGSAGNAEV